MSKQLSSFQPKNSTKLYMPLNGSSVDISGNGNHGVDTSISYVGGKFGQGARFNGSAYITIADNSSLDITSNLTLSYWLKTTQSTLAHIIEKDDESGFNRRGYNSYINSGQISFSVGNNSGYPSVTTTQSFNNDKWNYITCVYIPSTSITIFVNGIQVAQSTTSIPASLYNNGNNLNIGFRNNGGGTDRYYSGLLDEVIIENRAWTPQEISLYYRKSMLNYRTKSLFNLIKDFVMTGDTAVFTITGYNASLTLIQRLVAETANFIITGYDAIIKVAGAWRNNDSKSSTTYTNPDNKSSTNWTNTNKNS